MDKFASRAPEELITGFAKTKQTIMDSKQMNKKREDVIRFIGKWFYEDKIPFNTTSLPSF